MLLTMCGRSPVPSTRSCNMEKDQEEEPLKATKLCTLLAVVAMVTLAGASPPEESANAAVLANAPGREGAAVQAAERAQRAEPAQPKPPEPKQPERRPEPKAPRAEGDGLAELLASEDYLLLDVRRPEELEEHGTVEGYLNIPIEELADRLDEVPRDRPVLTA